MSMDDEKLARELRGRADEVTGAPLGLDDVKHTASAIRRRRVATAVGAAAVVVALALPVGLTMVDRDSATSDPAPAAPDPDPTPTGPVAARLTTDAPDGGAAETSYTWGDVVHEADGDEVRLPEVYDAFAPFGYGWLGVTYGENAGQLTVLDAEGSVVDTFLGGLGIAASGDGTLTAFSDAEGGIGTKGTADSAVVELDPPGRPMKDVDVVAVVGSESCTREEGCSVYFNEFGDLGGAYRIQENGKIWQYTLFSKLLGAAPDGRVAGLVSASDDGSCSGVFDRAERRLWETCDYTLGAFSPDGTYVIGRPAYLDGVGDGLVAILDAETGEMVAEFSNDRRGQAFVRDAVWETDRTLLATVFQQGEWGLMRMTDLGELEKVEDLGAGEDVDPPATLQ